MASAPRMRAADAKNREDVSMNAWSLMRVSMLPLALVLLAACDGDNPAPTADAHQPANDAEYGTGAQETRSPEEARHADSPNDDGDGVEDADETPRGEEPRRE